MSGGVARPTPDDVLAILRAAPGRIASATEGAVSEHLHSQPAAGEWSANEVLAHLRSCADVWGDAIATMLGEAEPTIRAVSPRTWIHDTDYEVEDFRVSLTAFTEQRAALLATLEALTPAQWSRRATVTGAGTPLVKTVLDYAERLARHERSHLTQIERTVAAVRS